MLYLLKELGHKERKPLRHLVRELLQTALDVRHLPGAKKRSLRGWHVSNVALPAGVTPGKRTTYWPAIQRPLP